MAFTVTDKHETEVIDWALDIALALVEDDQADWTDEEVDILRDLKARTGEAVTENAKKP